MALATKNLFHNFLLLRSLLPFKINILVYIHVDLFLNFNDCSIKVFGPHDLHLNLSKMLLKNLLMDIWIKLICKQPHGNVSCGPRKQGTCKWSEHIDRNNKVAIFTHSIARDVWSKWNQIYNGGALHSGKTTFQIWRFL